MKLLFDQNISFRVTKTLQKHFNNCMHVSDCGLQDCEDADIWHYAKENDFAIVTFDSDFYDISLIDGHPPKIIWIRTGNLKTTELVDLIIDHKHVIKKFLDDADYKDVACLELQG